MSERMGAEHYGEERVETAEALVELIAEELNHHPDVDIRWRTVRLAMTTHDVDGLSTLDIEAARRIDACIGALAG